MVPRASVPVMARSAFVVIALLLPLGPALFGRFFGFDFLAEFLFFGVSAAALFPFVVAFFDRGLFVISSFIVVAFFLVGFGFVVLAVSDERCRGGRQGQGVRRGGRGEQQQRGEQEDQQDREFPHGSLIGARCRPA